MVSSTFPLTLSALCSI